MRKAAGASPAGWRPTQKALHWLTAAAVFTLFALGLWMVHGPMDIGSRFELYQWHKSLGIAVLALWPVRLGLLWISGRPPLPDQGWRRRAAQAGHGALYALLLAMPLSGWVMASASPFRVPTLIFGLFPLPSLAGPSAATEAWANTLHVALAILLALLLIGHVAAALKHHLIDRDDTLRRMI